MLHLDLNPGPRWIDLGHGVEVEALPFDTEMRLAVDEDIDGTEADVADAVLADAAEPASPVKDRPASAWRVDLVKAVARRAIVAWSGVGDVDGAELDVNPEAIDALMSHYAMFEAFSAKYVIPAMLMVSEGNVSAPAPNGTTAGAPNTAPGV